MSRTQLQPLQLNSLPKAHEHDEYTARPGGNRSAPSWNTAPNNTSSSRSSMSGEESSSSAIDPTPGLPLGLSRPLNQIEQEKLAQLDRLKFFLATAPSRWDSNGSNASSSSSDPYLNMGMGMNSGLNIPHHAPTHPALNRFLLPTQEYVTCVLWNGLYHITGTDIVRALVFRFDAFGRPVRNMKKFEEGVFSDLRNLKPGQDASLEEPKSPFLDLLFKYQCIRTQKKQKVFYWFSVPHDRLFLDALERDLKREKMGLESTTQVVGEPALSFVYDGAFKRSLYEQFVKAAGGKEGEGELERVVRGLEEGDAIGFNGNKEGNAHAEAGMSSDADNDPSGDESASSSDVEGLNHRNQRGVGAPAADNPNSPFFNMFSLFEGSPTYKQRRKKPSRPSALSSAAMASTTSAQHGIVTEGIASNGDIVRGRYDMRTINGTPNSSVSSVNRYSYPPSGEQYALYPTGSTYSHDPRANIGYHPSSSPPNTTQYPILHNSYGMDVGYGQGEYSSNVSAGVRVKQESISAADMFLMQARGGLPNVPFVESRATKRHSYAGSSMETGTIPVWLEGKYTGVDMAASTSTPLPPFANRGKSMDHSMTVSSPYIQAQQTSSAASPYMSNVSMSESPPRSSTVSSPRDSRGSPISTSGSPSSVPPAPEVPATLPNPITIPGTSSSGAATTTKAYACPLLSCGRLFKRMEHLKRHLRTHTLERPFICTKDGCGKRFSRSDNLSQHLRVCKGGKSHNDTETSDNANIEGDSLGLSGMEWGVNVGEWINSEMDEEAQPSVFSANRGRATHVDADMDDTLSEQPSTADIGVGLNMFGGSGGLGMGMGMSTSVNGNNDYNSYPSSIPSSVASLDVPMELCEVELTGDVRDVHGDEEGLVRVHVRGESGDEGYFTGDSNYNTVPNSDPYNQRPSQQFYDTAGYVAHRPQHHSSLDSHFLQSNTRDLRAPSPRQSLDSHLDAQSQWALRGTPSPAFSTISVPSLSPNRTSWGAGSVPRPHPPYSRQHLNGTNEVEYSMEDPSVSHHRGSASLPVPGMNLSVSAPSHKLAFDHSNLYPQGMPEPSSALFAASMGGLSVDSSTAGGPVRRHRSMTPSLMRGADGGFVRRPTSGGGSGDNMTSSIYHPYASSSRASSLSRGGGSVHSSPAGHSMPLPGIGMQRSESRASSLSVEVSGSDHLHQARQMLSRPGSVDPSASSSNSYPGEVYRTESPAPFVNHLPIGPGQVTDSPGTFVVDLPRPGSSYQHPSHIHSATVPAQFGMSVLDEQFSMQGVNSSAGNGGFYPQHVSTI
ncbi:uncharacterized protein C8R40DRAFT_732454 [Lentinula edodes]|uniref:uncharacterized protein n=1 Tax=Lentinula edodes TaxID=5353 RepID=UPI001E8D41FD|nr:uncharacterized protein C8R40DRAFT_732454 [Lentinula edodes]KAH7869450.1 hypothetical protein C8R40DRAFT_732454 [Lentinula edodes]